MLKINLLTSKDLLHQQRNDYVRCDRAGSVLGEHWRSLPPPARSVSLTGTQIGPSITPLTDLNSGFRMYEVDSNVS